MIFRTIQFKSTIAVTGGVLWLLLFAGINSASAKDTYYQWIDENNITQFSETPPNEIKAIKRKVGNNPSSSYQSELEALEKHRVNQGKAIEAAKQASSDKEKKTDSEPAEFLKEQCKRAQGNLAAINKGGRVREQDKKTGEFHFLSDEERAGREQAAKSYITEYCPG